MLNGTKVYYSGGNVGIGTNSPNRALTIQSTGTAYLNLKASSGTYEVLLGADAAGGILSTMTNHDLSLRAGGNQTFMTIKTNGNVGIATTSPSNAQGWHGLLDVRGNLHSKLLVTTNNAEYKTGIFSHNTSWNGGGGFIGTESNHKLHFMTNYSPKMTLDINGNFGIGTLSPNAKLHIPNGEMILGGDVSFNPAHLNSTLVIKSKGDNSSTYPIYVGKQNSGQDLFWVRGDGNSYFLGNVGIGTTNPGSFKLAVEGKIGANEVVVTLERPWPDYVFEK